MFYPTHILTSSSIWQVILTFYHSIWHSVWYIFSDIPSGILSGIRFGILFDIHTRTYIYIFRHSIWHSIWRLVWHSIWQSLWQSLWHLSLAVEVRQCPLRSGARGWGPAVPTEIWSSQLTSSGAHWDRSGTRTCGPAVPAELELAAGFAVEQCPLISGARGEVRQCTGSAHWSLEPAVEGRRGEEGGGEERNRHARWTTVHKEARRSPS